MSQNPQIHGCLKLIDIKYHFLKDQMTKGTKMAADLLTKKLPKNQFMKLGKMIRIDKGSVSE